MKKIIYIAILLSLTGCKAKEVIKYVPVEKIRTEQVIMRDTIIDVQLIPHKDSVSLNDTISFLENKYAYSNASFTAGRLNHSLVIKSVKIPTEIQYIEKIVTDSIQVPVEAKGDIIIQYKRDFFWWCGLLSLLLIIVVIVLKIPRLFK